MFVVLPKKMKINIVRKQGEEVWILEKFANKLNEHLLAKGYESKVNNKPDPQSDINHHIIYLDYNLETDFCGNDTLMITHIDSFHKLNLIKTQLKKASLGICMSSETMQVLIAAGVPVSKLAFVLPAHDHIIQPRKKNIGICTRAHFDGRKREHFIYEIAKVIDNSLFKFTIMGDGLWPLEVEKLITLGFEVDYYPEFNYETYVKILPKFDYYLYTGMDEGQMGVLDAAAAGVETIITNQGYHLDLADAIYYGFTTKKELCSIFKSLSDRRKKGIQSVENLTWEKYTEEHIKIWENQLKFESKNNYKIKITKTIYFCLKVIKQQIKAKFALRRSNEFVKKSLIKKY